MLRPGLAISLLLALLGPGCARDVIGDAPPLDRPHYPVGMGLHPDGRWLAVAASNFDLEYSHGALLLADLQLVDQRLAGADPEADVVVPGEDAYVAGAEVPPFANRPVFIFDGSSMLLTTRSQNRIVEIGLDGADGDNPSLECDATNDDGVPRCSEAPSALQLSGNDPFELVPFTTGPDVRRAAVTALGATQIFFVRYSRVIENADDFIAQRSLGLEALAPDGEVRGVPGLAFRPAGNGLGSRRIFATLLRTTSGLRGRAADLIWFDPGEGADATISRLSLTAATGALEARSVAVSPSGDAVFVLVRDPDALLRVDLFNAGGAFSPHPGGVVSTCFAPTQVVVADVPTPSGESYERVLVTCFENQTVLAYDSLSLSETDAVRYFGRGPYDVVVDTNAPVPRAYVSFFQDDSIGVIDLIDDDGDARLVPRGRIGAQRDKPEDNR